MGEAAARPYTLLVLLWLVAAAWSSGSGSDPGPAPALVPHAPILILGDAGFTPANGVVGGSGTPSNPYVIAGWDIDATLSNGIDIQDTKAHVVLRDLYVHSTPLTLDYAAIQLSTVENARVDNVTVEDTLYGLWGKGVTNLTVARSAISRTGHHGIYLNEATNVTILDSAIQDSGVLNTLPDFFTWDGIALYTARTVTIAGNRLTGNDEFGVNAYDARSVTVTDNRFEGNWGGSSIWLGYDLTLARNVANNQSGSGIDFVGAHNVTVEDNRASNTLIGVYISGILGDPLLQNENVTVRRNVLPGNWIGMLLHGLVEPLVSDNVMRGNLNPAMIVERTEGGRFTGNVVEATQWDGVQLYQANRTAWLRNDFSGNVNYGLHAIDSHDAILVENRVAANGVGVALEGSTGFLLHHNLFEGNAIQAQDDFGAVNAWDDGYPSGGNWWSDYGGVDLCSGPLQNICPSPDAIGDTPYGIDFNSQDRYPLWTPAAIPPVAVFNVTPPSGNITTAFTFDASGSWDANEPAANLTVRWDWEDDGTWDTPASTNKTAVHTYPAVGVYDVRLQVRDSTNLTNETTREVLVENTPPRAAFDVAPAAGNVTTTFTANATYSSDLEDAAAALEVRWDWDGDFVWDTGWSASKVASHQYPASGNFTIRLQVRDSGGLTAEASRSVEVSNLPPTAAFDLSPASGNVSTLFTADASTSSDLEDPAASLEVRWDWEDDGAWDTTWSTTKTATHAFPAVGVFTVRLEVRDTGGLVDDATRTASVANTAPTASLSAAPALGGLATAFAFDASSSADLEDPPGALQARWDWEDDGAWDTTWSTGLAASHAYGIAGFHVARVEVQDTGGLVATATATVEVRPGPVTTLHIGSPNVTAANPFLTPATPLGLTVDDRSGAGIVRTEYRVDGGPWLDYAATGPFTISGDGPHVVDWFSEDGLDNVEATQSATLVVDGSAPSQTLAAGTPTYAAGGTWITSSTSLTLLTADAGAPPVGLATVEVRTWFGGWSPWVPYSGPLTLSGEGTHHVEYRASDLLGNTLQGNTSWNVDDSPPAAALIAGTPQVADAGLFITSSTPISLVAEDLGPSPVGGDTLEYRVWLGAWSPWTAYPGAFTLTGRDGEAYVEFRATDLLGNTAPPQNTTLLVDDIAPTTVLSIGAPQHLGAGTFVTSSTPLALTATDGGATPVGLAGIEYRTDAGPWQAYAGPFTVSGEGAHVVGYRALDRLGNTEAERSLSVVIDNTPPITALAPQAGPFAGTTNFTLSATDIGSGVAGTELQIDGAAWVPSPGAFRLPPGNHTVRFRSVDHLGNREAEATAVVVIPAPPEPTPSPNYKPYVAAAFAVVLLGTGYWRLVLRRQEAPVALRRRDIVIHAAPWAIAEAATGVLSAATGLLSIPPLLGPGTAVDGAILLLGLIWIWDRGRRLAGEPHGLPLSVRHPEDASEPPQFPAGIRVPDSLPEGVEDPGQRRSSGPESA